MLHSPVSQYRPQSNSERNDRHVLVVGGAGYVGNVLIRQLLALGYRVRCLDALYYPTGNTIAPLMDNPSFSFVRGDLRDTAVVQDSLSGITDVVLLAALVGDPISKKYSELTREVNEAASRRLYSELAGRGIKKFIFTSTCSNYGILEGNQPATETSPLNPKSVYAETKVAFEEFVTKPSNATDFSTTVLRLATAFGLSPRMRFDLTVSEFSREIAMGRELIVYDEATWRPYCHVSDISEAIIRVIEAPTDVVSGQVFNVGGNENNFTKKMIVDELVKLVPDAKVTYKAGGFDQRDYRVSFDKIRGALDFAPKYSVPSAIAHVVSCIQAGLYGDVEESKNFYGNYVVNH
ncbi:MAG: NAD(P)-dependent oxidoreductase [Hyphomicrobiaceae bacterium]